MATSLLSTQLVARNIRLLSSFQRCRRPLPAPSTSLTARRSRFSTSAGTDLQSASVMVSVPGMRSEEKFELPRSLFEGEGEGTDKSSGEAKIVVAMSGGVDSSLTLALLNAFLQSDPLLTPSTSASPPLRRKPISLSAVFMRNWSPLQSESTPSPSSNPTTSECSWKSDLRDIHLVSRHLGLDPERDVKMIDLSREYWLDVFEPAVGVWEEGGTPNPDVGCNREIKFGALMDRTLTGPNQFLATGHYARLARYYEDHQLHKSHCDGQARAHQGRETRLRTRLLRSSDEGKDQTYYLSSVPEEKLAKAIFPLAFIPKHRVRELARYYGLPTAEREESMGVCFIGERGRFGDFVSQYTSPAPKTPGNIITPSGTILGTHDGLWHYTIGQRARIGGLDGRWFVSDKRKGENEVVVVPGSEHPNLLSPTLITLPNFSWIHPDHPPSAIDTKDGLRAFAQVRHRMKAVPCTVKRAKDRSSTALEITFDQPEKAIAPGQVVGLWSAEERTSEDGMDGTFEAGEWCLGSGVIASRTILTDNGST